jgi:hypothetical protein
MVESRMEVYIATETIVRTITSGWNGRTVIIVWGKVKMKNTGMGRNSVIK